MGISQLAAIQFPKVLEKQTKECKYLLEHTLLIWGLTRNGNLCISKLCILYPFSKAKVIPKMYLLQNEQNKKVPEPNNLPTLAQ